MCIPRVREKEKYEKKKRQRIMKWAELIENTAWVAEGVLTTEECQRFLERAREDGISEMTAAGDVRHRNSTTVPVVDEELAQRVFERIKDHLPQEVFVDENCQNLGLMYNKEELYGRWTVSSLNPRWRVACYQEGGHFGPHRDAYHKVDENHRSLITLNGYLTDRPTGFGGATRFVQDDIDVHLNNDGIFTTPDDAVLHRVEADKAGKAVVFFHDLMHDGEPLKEGSPEKWLFRTDIMYRRDPETAPKWTPEQKEARELLKQAEAAETEGDISSSLRFYKKAYRLDPSLDSGSALL